MTEQQNTTTEEQENKVDGRTTRAADIALAKKQISPDSHKAIHEGRIDLKTARDLGREGSPYAPVVRVDKNDRTPTKTPCLCGCDELVPRTFKAGHDQRMYRVAREHLTEGRELNEEQAEYLQASGKMARVKARLVEEDRRRAEKEAKKKPKK